jgi:zinc transporter ZupT
MTKNLKDLAQNLLISFGVFWLSLLPLGILGGLFHKLTDGIRYGDSLYSGIAMGVMTSLGQTVAAILAGILVTLAVSSRKPTWWAVIVAALYVVDAPVSFHWEAPPMMFDRVWQSVNLLFPAGACIAAAVATARLRRGSEASPDAVPQSVP